MFSTKPLIKYDSFNLFAQDNAKDWRWNYRFDPELLAPMASHYKARVTVHGDMSLTVHIGRGDDHYWAGLDKMLGIKLRPKSRLTELLPDGSTLWVDGARLPLAKLPMHGVFYLDGDQLRHVDGPIYLCRVGFQYSRTARPLDNAPHYAIQNGADTVAEALDRPYLKQLRGLHRKLAGVRSAWEALLPDVADKLPAYASWSVNTRMSAAVPALIKEWAATGDIASFVPDSLAFKAWHAPIEMFDSHMVGEAHRIKGPVKILAP